jgi:hypothetical protein
MRSYTIGVSGNERIENNSGVRGWFKRHDIHPWVFLAHAIAAVGAFGLGTVGLLEGAGVGAVPVLGVGILILILGRSAARIAARR